MTHSLIETFTDFLDKIHHTTISQFSSQRQGVHKHAESVLDTDITTAAADGTDKELIVAGEAGKDQ